MDAQVLARWSGAKVTLQKCSGSSAPNNDDSLVVLFGWMLARDKNLAKYANLFSDVVDTIRVTAPMRATMSNPRRGTRFASKFLDLVVRGSEWKNKKKVVAIFFSNNGAVVLERLNSIARYYKYP